MSESQPQKLRRDRRSELPAQSAGQIVWLTMAVIIAGLPHYPFLIPWVPALAFSIAVWRSITALKRWRLPPTWFRATLTVGTFAAVLGTYRQISGLDAGSALLLVMVSMKLLETRGHRDRAVVIFICYFLLFAAFLREQALWSAAYLIAGVVITTACLVQIARRGSVIEPGKAIAIACGIVLQAVPLMLMLFILFPRVPGPFWALPQRGGTGMTGLAENMTPGDITELAQSDEVAFRVRFDGDPPSTSALYWRGPVMNAFDGRTWSMQNSGKILSAPVEGSGPVVSYELTLEPHGQRWLLALETPQTWTYRGAQLTVAQQLVTVLPIEQRISYRGRSTLGSQFNQIEPEATLALARQLPESANPRTSAFAKELRAQSANDSDYLKRILQKFRQESFYYTLKPAALGASAIDDFLFKTRSGFCGHYASAFTALARAAGLPARVVTGYQGGEPNPLGDYWIVRQSSAHAWAEVWINNRWTRYDPTAAVAPERIQTGLADAISDGSLRSRNPLSINPVFRQLALSWDVVNATWNSWVLAYGPDSQNALMKASGIATPSTRHLIITMIISVSTFLLVLGLYQRYRDTPRSDLLLRSYRMLCARTAQATRSRLPAEGPAEYATAAGTLRPDLSEPIRALFGEYIRLRYEIRPDPELEKQFQADVTAFRPAPGRNSQDHGAFFWTGGKK